MKTSCITKESGIADLEYELQLTETKQYENKIYMHLKSNSECVPKTSAQGNFTQITYNMHIIIEIFCPSVVFSFSQNSALTSSRTSGTTPLSHSTGHMSLPLSP